MNWDDFRALLGSFLQEWSAQSPPVEWLAISALGMLSAGMLWLLYRSVCSIAELRKLLAETAFEASALRRTFGVLEAQRPVERLQALEEQVAALTKGQEQLMLSDSATASYLHAIRHAQRGADVEELMRTHGMARAEAELIVALHVEPTKAAGEDPAG